MLGSITWVSSNPDDLETALRAEGCLSLLITGRGEFRARLIQVTLHHLRLSAAEEHLSRIAFIAVPADTFMIWFPVGRGAALVCGGIGLRAGEIMILSPSQRLHARSDGPSNWGAICLPIEYLVRYGSALTGSPLVVPPGVRRWRPPTAVGRSLRGLHAAATRLAACRPQAFTNAKTAHGLEQQLIHGVVECLSAGFPDHGTQSERWHQDIMVRFEYILQNQPNRKLLISEVCSALGISNRLLRTLCAAHLRMSPTSYDHLRRITLAHRALCRGNSATASVSEIARRYGFRHLGRFTANYRARFGELPSATLRRDTRWRLREDGWSAAYPI